MTPATRFKKVKEKARRLVKGGRNGRKLMGGIYDTPSGGKMFLSYQFRKDIYRNGEKSISAAHDKGVACWAIDYDTLLEMRRKGVETIGIYVRDEEMVYFTKRENFLDEDKCRIMNYDPKGGVLQKYLPLRHFAKTKML